jgi:hypothetical protein
LVVESGEPPLVFADPSRFKRPRPIARDLDRDRPVVGQDRRAARPVPVIGRLVGLRAAGGYPR